MKSKNLEKQNLLKAEQELLSMYRKLNVEDKTHMYEFIKKYKNEGPEENHPLIQKLLVYGYAHFTIEGVVEELAEKYSNHEQLVPKTYHKYKINI